MVGEVKGIHWLELKNEKVLNRTNTVKVKYAINSVTFGEKDDLPFTVSTQILNVPSLPWTFFSNFAGYVEKMQEDVCKIR